MGTELLAGLWNPDCSRSARSRQNGEPAIPFAGRPRSVARRSPRCHLRHSQSERARSCSLITAGMAAAWKSPWIIHGIRHFHGLATAAPFPSPLALQTRHRLQFWGAWGICSQQFLGCHFIGEWLWEGAVRAPGTHAGARRGHSGNFQRIPPSPKGTQPQLHVTEGRDLMPPSDPCIWWI